eukprot:1862651-Prymnesium_polylepis.2
MLATHRVPPLVLLDGERVLVLAQLHPQAGPPALEALGAVVVLPVALRRRATSTHARGHHREMAALPGGKSSTRRRAALPRLPAGSSRARARRFPRGEGWHRAWRMVLACAAMLVGAQAEHGVPRAGSLRLARRWPARVAMGRRGSASPPSREACGGWCCGALMQYMSSSRRLRQLCSARCRAIRSSSVSLADMYSYSPTSQQRGA